MKILFFCGSAEPGKDGVGDYTRRLCGKLIKLGQTSQILSLCDKQVISFTKENQIVDETTVVVSRIPISATTIERFNWSQEILNDFKPDWTSLQFVPYSYNPKGLPFWLPSFLKKLKGNHKWHIMFHELWVGIDMESSIKLKCIGKIQQILIKQVVGSTKAAVINTQNKLYQFLLHSHNVMVEVLPIFGNIPRTAIKKQEIANTQFVLFGTIHEGAPFRDFIHDIKMNLNSLNKPVKFVFIGNNGEGLSEYTFLLENQGVCYEVLGIQSEKVISQVLLDSDFGISTTPYFQTEKSGVYAAYREHQLTTICVARNWTPTKGQYEIPQIIRYKNNNLNLKPTEVTVFDLESLAKQFINSIS